MDRRGEILVQPILHCLLADIGFTVINDDEEIMMEIDDQLVGWCPDGGHYWTLLSLWNERKDKELWVLYAELQADFSVHPPVSEVRVKIELIFNPDTDNEFIRVGEVRTVRSLGEWELALKELILPALALGHDFENE